VMEELRMSNDSGGRLATAHWKLLLQGCRCGILHTCSRAVQRSSWVKVALRQGFTSALLHPRPVPWLVLGQGLQLSRQSFLDIGSLPLNVGCSNHAHCCALAGIWHCLMCLHPIRLQPLLCHVTCRYENRLPIGRESVIKGVPAEAIAAFYRRW
jgi:hypothetical protein